MQWIEFCELATARDEGNAPRYIRINPKIGTPPKLDDVKRLIEVQQAARDSLESEVSKAQIRQVARMLVASSFYFERTSVPKKELGDKYTCSGQLNESSTFSLY